MTESSHSRFGDSSETIVRLRGVSRSYSPNTPPALVPTDLDIREGEFFSLLGPSGSGKTTTLRIIAGFEAPDSGKVFIDSEDVTRIPPYRRNTNTVFQNYALFPHMTIAENVAYPLRMRGEDRGSMGTRVGEALELVNMTGFDDRLPHMLSGGQRQRVALARAIVGRPRVLLLDEPLGALDLKLRQQMQHALTALQRELGITFIFVTHDQGEALSMSNQVAVMNEGRVEQVGTPWELYYKPHSAFVANFIGQSNIIEVFAENSGGETRFRIGSISVASPPGTNPGPYRIGLRYEAILIARDAHELTSDVIFDARVDDVLFLGSSVEYTLKAEGVELMALARSQKDLVLKRGQKIAAGFNTSDLVVLDD